MTVPHLVVTRPPHAPTEAVTCHQAEPYEMKGLLDPKRIDREKRADADHSVMGEIARRWSPRAFQDRDVESERLLRCLEAARWSASNFNEQPWRFMVATRDDDREFARMLDCLTEPNQRWAHKAPVLMLTFAKCTYSKNGKKNRTAEHDVGLAAANLTLQATREGLVVHQMAGIDLERIRDTYDVPEDFVPVAGVALGYRGDPDTLDDDLYERELQPRSRKPLTSFVFQEEWDHPADLVR